MALKNMEMNSKQEKYNKLLELQKKYQAGIIKDEDLTYKQIILLNRLYDIQLQELEDKNEITLNKVKNYMKKMACN